MVCCYLVYRLFVLLCFALRRDCLTAVRSGLCILLTLLSQGESCDASKPLADCGVVEVVGKIRRHLPGFPNKDELCSCVTLKTSSPGNQSMDSLSEAKVEEERGRKPGREGKGERDASNGSRTKGIESEVISGVRSLRRYYSCRHGRNPVSRLLKLISKDLHVGDNTFVRPPPQFTETFLRHSGVLCLAEAISENKSSYFVEGALL